MQAVLSTPPQTLTIRLEAHTDCRQRTGLARPGYGNGGVSRIDGVWYYYCPNDLGRSFVDEIQEMCRAFIVFSIAGTHDSLAANDVTRVVFHAGHWDKHFSKFVDCRPIYVREALENAGFKTQQALVKHMWVPVEIVLGLNE